MEGFEEHKQKCVNGENDEAGNMDMVFLSCRSGFSGEIEPLSKI